MGILGVDTGQDWMHSDPHTLPGTQILGVTTEARRFRHRVHRQAAQQENECELWYYRESAWRKFPADSQPVLSSGIPITLNKSYRQPATLDMSIPDNLGLLTPTNANSAYNYLSDGVTWDPLLDEARKILLRAGCRCFTNLAPGKSYSAPPPSAGTLSMLSDELFGNIESANANIAFWNRTTPFDIQINLGADYFLRHIAVRFATKAAACALPDSVQIILERNGEQRAYPLRHVGGAEGDWEDSDLGRMVEVAFTDLDWVADFIYIQINLDSARVIAIDEIGVYGGDSSEMLGANIFCGYLGDQFDVSSPGLIQITATDVLKKLADNNEVRLTNLYTRQDVARIVYNLLTSPIYWRGSGAAYDAPFTSGEIGWGATDEICEFVYPAWQGQSNSVYGYCSDLLYSIGWEIYADGNGVIQLREPPYRAVLPERVLIADPDGNGDCRKLARRYTGKDMRNIVEVATGKATGGSFQTVVEERNSRARYGPRRVVITDPIATDSQTRQKIGEYVLRDYAWRVVSLSGELAPDLHTRIKGVYGFRASRRPSIFSKKCTLSGKRREQELWTVETLTERIARGEWAAEFTATPYRPLGPSSPLNVVATPDTDDTIINISWNAPGDTYGIWGYRVYMSDTNDFDDFTQVADVGFALNNVDVTGLTPGARYWFYVVAYGPAPANAEGIASTVVSALAGGAAEDENGWTVTDLSVAFNQLLTPEDANGYYEYEFALAWTSPPLPTPPADTGEYGFKHAEFRFHIGGALPANDELQNSWTYQDEWHGDRVPPGKMWDRTTAGQLIWYGRFRSQTDLSGANVYWRMWTWRTTNGRHGPPHPSNVDSAVIP